MELTNFLDGGPAKTEERLKLESYFLDDFVAKVHLRRIVGNLLVKI